ncbi:MAG TPA: hypothetical protein VMQ81_02440 [Acidimicrobiia bacterium]|nr:hypothetical protein [Acidimicrobiia bacterium]
MPIEHIAIEQGRQPWTPSPGSETVDTFHFYDLPLIGIVRQAQQLHLFRCLEGHTNPYSLWAYVNVSPDEAAQLRVAAPNEEFDDVVGALTARRPTVVALAHETGGIVRPPWSTAQQITPRSCTQQGSRFAPPLPRWTTSSRAELPER